MPLVKVLAKDWVLEIYDGSWITVGGLTTLGFGSSKTDADTKTFDSDGWDEHVVAGRGRTLALEGKYLEDPDTGARDDGQQAVDAAGELIGQASLVLFRLTSPGGNAKEFYASVNPKDVGGGNNDPTTWGADLTLSGGFTTSASNNLSALAGIEENTGAALTLIPAFAAGTYEYSATVNTLSDWVKFTPAAAAGVITVDGAIVSTTVQSGEVAVAAGLNEIFIKVKESGKSEKIYKVVIARP